jgi:hypothetical protein
MYHSLIRSARGIQRLSRARVRYTAFGPERASEPLKGIAEAQDTS